MFDKAIGTVPRAKIMVFGDTGSGKTVFGLQWGRLGGNLAVIDTEASTHRYDKEFGFHREEPKNIHEFLECIDWLTTEKHEFTTLMIDAVTIVWDWVLQHWEERFLATRGPKGGKPAGKGHRGDHYELQPADWRIVKAYWRRIFQRLRRMDLNVIVTARAKPLYAEGEMMRKIGETFDSEKGTGYEMDTVLHLEKKLSQYFAKVKKHRSFDNPMPGEIDITDGIGFFREYFGDAVTRTAVPVVYVKDATLEEIFSNLAFLGMEEQKARRNVFKKYGVSAWSDLDEETAQELLTNLAAKAAKKEPW